MAQQVKNLPAMQDTQEALVESLGWEDPLEEEMAAHSSILAWEIPWTEEPGGLQSMGSQRVGHDWAIKHTYTFNFFVTKGFFLPCFFFFPFQGIMRGKKQEIRKDIEVIQ